MDRTPVWLIDLGISALLRIVADNKDRKRWAKALAKIFVAIQNAATMDASLEHEIALQRAKGK